MPITNKAATLLHLAPKSKSGDIEADFWRELKALEAAHPQDMTEIEAESIGWTPLDHDAYLHTSSDDILTIDIVGIATASMASDNVLWLL